MDICTEIPWGGCKKTTPGYVEQIFDANGNCISQRFIAANEDIEYCGRYANILKDDKRTNFYYPFDMKIPKLYLRCNQ
jgi:hypothetical protein